MAKKETQNQENKHLNIETLKEKNRTLMQYTRACVRQTAGREERW